MELLVLGGLVGGLCWLARHWPVRLPTFAPSPRELAQIQRTAIALQQEQRRQVLLRQRQQVLADQRRRVAARNMQVAILQIGDSPDFRRAASHAELARDVPLEFRQRQFRRLRPLLLRHLVTKLRGGQTVELATAGLVDLVTALGIAEYEAEYLIREATTSNHSRAATPTTFTQQSQQWQSELRQRLEAIQGLTDVDPDLREQLIEQEQQRFRERMTHAGEPTSANERLTI